MDSDRSWLMKGFGRRILGLCQPARCLATLLAVLLAFAARAQNHSYEAAAELFAEGRYKQAIEAASALETANGYALTARARLIWAGYYADPETYEPQIQMALDDAMRAIDRDPDHMEANLQAAAAYGYQARLTRDSSDVRASRDHLEAAAENGADNPWLQAGFGSWHGETVIGAGGFLAGLMFGASRSEAVEAFERAIDLAPDSPALRVTYAKLLIRFDKKRYRDPAREQLKAGLSRSPKQHLDAILQKQARRLLAVVEAGDWDEAERLAEGMMPFSGR